MKDFAAFLAAHRAQVEPLEIERDDAWWQVSLSSAPEAEERAAEAEKRLTRLYSADPAAYAALKALDTTGLSPDEARQSRILRDRYAAAQMDDAYLVEMVDTERRVDNAFNTFRPLLRGKPVSDNALREILRDSDDPPLRREAWEASKSVGGLVETDVLRLVEMRNAAARQMGYPDYFVLSLSLLQEIEPDVLFGLLNDLETQTNPLWQARKAEIDAALAARFQIPAADLRPWHYSDPFFQEAPTGEADLDRFYKDRNLEAITESFFDAIGLPIADILTRSDLYERENKNQHAFCLHVGRFDDVRVLCNCTGSERWMSTMLHEFGHAVYDRYLGDDLPFFLRDAAHTLTTEAIAMVMGRFSRSAAFLETYVGVPESAARQVADSAAREQATHLLIMARWCLVMVHFERALYADPTQDLNRLWWQMVRRFQHVAPPDEEERASAPDWAAKLHLSLAPVYYHNYLLGEMFASQLLDYLQARVVPENDLPVRSPAVGAYLRRAVFAPGARYPWNVLIEHATGEPLNPAHFVAHLR